MKNNLLIGGLAIVSILSALPGCRKSDPGVQPSNPALRQYHSLQTSVASDSVLTLVPFPEFPLTGCPNDPNYGDSVVFPQPSGTQDYIVRPINSPGSGRYLSWPAGMIIDSNTGAIDLTASDAGQQYAIGFVRAGTTDTCISTLIIAGASYMDSIYNLGDHADKAFPYFDANPNLASVCGSSPNGSPGCQFDVTGSATNHKMVIDKSTGEIDLKKSLNGIFGPDPVNGQMAEITIYYQLNDPSNMALQQIQVELIYYDSESAMSAGLLDKIKNRHAQESSGQLVSPNNTARPPLIVIIRHF
jgi:hypothetical protein